MKKCKYSEETQKVLKEILTEMEQYRMSANERNDHPPSDYPQRVCQAIIAEKMGFEHRVEWHKDDFLGFKAVI